MAGPAPGGDSGPFRRIGHSPSDADGPCHRQFSLYGGLGDLSAAAQSSQIFQNFPYPLTLRQVLWAYRLLKASWHVADGTAAVADSFS